MRRRSLIIFVLLNVLISLGVVALALNSNLFGLRQESSSSPLVITVPVVYTATIGPSQTPFVITATPPPGVVALPTGIIESLPNSTNQPVPTIDPEIIGASAALQGTATALPANCILHTVKEGDTPFAIAETYGANGFDLMEVNALDEARASNLQIGDVLIIPLEGCSLTAADLAQDDEEADVTISADASPTPETFAEGTTAATAAPTRPPTATLPPTAVNAQVEIVRVRDVGDVTAEGVEIRNNGAVVALTGWTLQDSEGNSYTFPERRLFTGGLVTVFTRVGDDTAIALFWGRTAPVFTRGESVTLLDAQGRAQSTLVIP